LFYGDVQVHSSLPPLRRHAPPPPIGGQTSGKSELTNTSATPKGSPTRVANDVPGILAGCGFGVESGCVR
jgi:hypothetical protein